VESVYRELSQRWHVFYILPNQSSYYRDPQIAAHWRQLLGQRFLRLADPGAACELIALTVGLGEDRVDISAGLANLRDIGTHAEATAVGRSLAAAVSPASSDDATA
jgi:hypothetical protein